MKQTIVSDLENWKIHGIAPKFYFDGQATPLAQETQMRESTTASTKIEAAWKLYTDNRPQEAVTAFGKAGAVRAHDLTNFFQQVLFDLGIAFEVAPYSACAQMAYIDRQDTDWALGVYGPPELLVYNINDSIITKIDAEKGVVQGLVKSQLLTKLACTEETFIDAFLMTGTSSLPAFPPLRDAEVTTKQPYTILDAVNMYRAHGKSFITLCELWAEHLKKHDPTWQDKYQRARMAIKHAVVISLDGQVEVDHFDELTEDHHEYIGLHLAPELYHYQAKNVVSPRVLNWLSSLKMYVSPPLDGAESPEYRKLVADLMTPIQEQAVSLYASRLHRAFQHKAVEKYVWYDDAKTIKLNHRDVTPQPEKQAASWRVDGSTLKKVPTGLGKVGSFGLALKSLEDDTFRAETIKKTPAPEPAIIISAMGIKANAIWRFLHLRGYINDEHVLTEWGNALLTTIKAAPLAHQEEAAVLAFELLRLGVLNVDNPKWDWIGAPNMGSEEQNTLCLLISRVACLLPFRHQEIGYTGPLSRNLLAYHSVVNAVRECDRDLIETVVATMFLNAHAERRDRKDWDKLGYRYAHHLPIDPPPFPSQETLSDNDTSVCHLAKVRVWRWRLQ